MSRESALAFYEKLESDNELIERIKGMTVPEVEKLVKDEMGYDFTKDEMQKVIFEKNPELSDEELEAVVGGLSELETGLTVIGIGGAGVGIGGVLFAAGAGILVAAAVA